MLTAIILSIMVLLLLLHLESRKPKGYPPGPRWWPILGSAIEVSRIRQRTGYLAKTFSALCKKYGPVFGLKIGSDRIVVLNDYNSVQAMLTNPDCDGRPTGPMYTARTWGERKGLILVDGDLWISQRRFVLRHLRKFGYGNDSMTLIVEDEARRLVEHFEKLMLDRENSRLNKNQMNIRNNKYSNDNNNNDGQIYKLLSANTKKDKQLIEEKTRSEEHNLRCNSSNLKIEDMYVKMDDCIEMEMMRKGRELVIWTHDPFGVTVLNTLWRMMANKRYDVDDKELKYLHGILTKVMEAVDMIGAPFSHFPFLRFVAPELSGYRMFVESHHQLLAFLEKELKNHKSTFKMNSPRDLMDLYLDALQSKDCDETFSESQLLAICMDLFIAGSDTTSKTLQFCFFYLVLYPEVQKKAQQEIDSIIGRERFPKVADRVKMSYLNAIVLESLRMFVGRNLNVPHRTLRETNILNYKIPKDTMILVNFNGLLMNKSWSDPDIFRPERFIDESGNIVIPNQYFPFSNGRHRCMGESLAKCNLFVITTALLQRFTFSLAPGQKRPSPDEYIDGVTAGPKPFKMLITCRDF